MSENLRNGSGSSSSSLSSSFHDTEDDQTIANMLAEDETRNAGNRQLGKRLSHLDSIPHAPRVNGEIPDVNDATLDHETLSERLVTYGLSELQMEGDGNCQFRALADQLFHNPEYHKHVRRQVIKQLKNHKTLYEAYVPMEYKSYIKKMKKLDISGDQFYFDFIREHSINDNTNSVFACCLATDQESGEIMLLYKQLQTVLKPKFA